MSFSRVSILYSFSCEVGYRAHTVESRKTIKPENFNLVTVAYTPLPILRCRLVSCEEFCHASYLLDIFQIIGLASGEFQETGKGIIEHAIQWHARGFRENRFERRSTRILLKTEQRD